MRLKGYDYNTPGYYFITVCTKNKRKLLCEIIGTVLPDGPQTRFTEYGKIARKQLLLMQDFYEDIHVDKFVIMPNHIHMILCLTGDDPEEGKDPSMSSKIGRFVGTFKRFCNRQYGKDIWQSRSHDHVIRGEADYQSIWNYIDGNPSKWLEDRFFVE